MTSLRLYKREKLCSLTAIDCLFSRSLGSHAAMAFPLRAVWHVDMSRDGGARFLISVPKKRMKHAVDRVAMRRKIRESYRLNRQLAPALAETPVDIAFIFVSDTLQSYRRIDEAMKKLLAKIGGTIPNITDPKPDAQADC